MAPTWVLLALGLIAAAPGLALRRHGPWPLRFATLLVLLGIGAAALDWPREREVTETAHRVVVAAGPVTPELHAELAARLGAAGWRLAPCAPRAADVATALAVAAQEERAVPLLLWSAPIAGALAGTGAPVVTATAPLPFEPEALSLRVLGPLVQGRPAAFELDAPVGLQGATGEVRVVGSDGALRASQAIGADADWPLRIDVAEPGSGQVQVAVALQRDGVAVTARGSLTVASGVRVLAVGASAGALVQALGVQGIEAAAADALPPSLAGIDVLLLAERVDSEASARVRAFVEAGGGLLLAGGPDGGAVPADGEDLAPLSPVALPVRPVRQESPGGQADVAAPPGDAPPPVSPPKAATGDTSAAKPPPVPGPTEIERRSVAMVLVVDRSASMAEPVAGADPLRRTRMDYVRSSAEATVRRLWPGDQLAIVTFGNMNAEEVVLPLTGVEDLATAYGALGRLQARSNEGTYLDSALARAASLLGEIEVPVKHVVVITDGVIVDLRPQSSARAQELRARGITVSLVRFGAETPDTMHFAVDCRTFARLGGGQYVFSTRTDEVPALVSDEVRRVFAASGRPDGDQAPVAQAGPGTGGRDRTEVPPPAAPDPPSPPPVTPAAPLTVRALAASPLLAPLPAQGLPPVAGVLDAVARHEAFTLLAAGDGGRPLLAFANRGLGRVGVFTAGFDRAWADAWLASPEYPSWLARWVTALAPPRPTPPSADLFGERQVAPRGPSPAEVRALTAWSGSAPDALASLAPPSPMVRRVREGSAMALALAVAAAILGLAFVEFVAVRRR